MINSIHPINFNAPELSKVLNLKLECGVFRTERFYFLEQNVVLNFREKSKKFSYIVLHPDILVHHVSPLLSLKIESVLEVSLLLSKSEIS
jgi:hypothetical protein